MLSYYCAVIYEYWIWFGTNYINKFPITIQMCYKYHLAVIHFVTTQMVQFLICVKIAGLTHVQKFWPHDGLPVAGDWHGFQLHLNYEWKILSVMGPYALSPN